MVHLIVRCTDKKPLASYREYNNKHPTQVPRVFKEVTRDEMYTLMGILICVGANNSNASHTKGMWKPSSFPLYRETMGMRCFWQICRFIRFDDANTRPERMQTDKAAPIRDLWLMLKGNLSKMYTHRKV